MTTKESTYRLKISKALIGILLSGFITLVAFYFDTTAMTEQNVEVNLKQQLQIVDLEQKTEDLKLQVALEQAERKHNKETLDRIEKKVDELLER